MAKSHTTLSIDGELLDKTKALGLNMSAIFEDAVSIKIGEKKNIDDKLLSFDCHGCGKTKKEGYLCPNRRIAWCEKCHAKLDIHKECSQFHVVMDSGENKSHFHTRIGKVKTVEGQTIEDIERGVPQHVIR